jgi:hypothetical protein
MLLLGSGLIGLAGCGRKKFFKKYFSIKFEEGKGRVVEALPFLFVSFGNHQLQGQPPIVE